MVGRLRVTDPSLTPTYPTSLRLWHVWTPHVLLQSAQLEASQLTFVGTYEAMTRVEDFTSLYVPCLSTEDDNVPSSSFTI